MDNLLVTDIINRVFLLLMSILLSLWKNHEICKINKMFLLLQGFRNDFQEAMDQVDQAYLDEILKSSKPEESQKKGDVNVPEEEVTYDDIQKMAENLHRRDKEEITQVIIQFLQFLVRMWGHQLNSRGGAEKMSTKGKMDSATYAQTREYLKPLLNKLKKKSLPDDITESLTVIVKHLLERNYLLVRSI